MSLRARVYANRRRLIGGALIAVIGITVFPFVADSAWRWPFLAADGLGLALLAMAAEDLIWGGRRG